MRCERYENLMKCHESPRVMEKVIIWYIYIYDKSTLSARLFLLFLILSFCRIIYMIHKSDTSFCETMMFPLTPTSRARYRIWTRSSKFREIPTHVGGRFRASFFFYWAYTRTYAYHPLSPFANLRSTNTPRAICRTEFLISLFTRLRMHASYMHACDRGV